MTRMPWYKNFLDATLRLAHVYADKIVEALACCCLSSLYYQVRDDEKEFS